MGAWASLLARARSQAGVEVMDRGEESMTGFMSGIKGKAAEFGAAEFGAADQLREAGWTQDPRPKKSTRIETESAQQMRNKKHF